MGVKSCSEIFLIGFLEMSSERNEGGKLRANVVMLKILLSAIVNFRKYFKSNN